MAHKLNIYAIEDVTGVSGAWSYGRVEIMGFAAEAAIREEAIARRKPPGIPSLSARPRSGALRRHRDLSGDHQHHGRSL